MIKATVAEKNALSRTKIKRFNSKPKEKEKK